jgi:hypothetical protein
MRFSIRDLLWATLVVAMGLGWWIDRTELEERRRDTLDALYEHGQILFRAYEKGYVDKGDMEVEIGTP